MPIRPQVFGPFLKGTVASTDIFTQPRGSVPRTSNLILTTRGALTDCDGTAIINAFNGTVPFNGRGRFECIFLFQPIGVDPYYLVLAQAPDQKLGAPEGLSVGAATAGGSLAAGTYYYKITALDGLGGETTAPIEASGTTAGGNLTLPLTWNVVPNAFAYNVYRGTAPGAEVLLVGTGLPVPQPAIGTGQVTYNDNGSATPGVVLTISTIRITTRFMGVTYAQATTTGTASIGSNQPCTIAGVTPGSFNGSATIEPTSGAVSNFTLFGGPWGGLAIGATGTGGTLTTGSGPPLIDTTQQVALFQMPRGVPPISYDNTNIVALFPASLTPFGQIPTGGSGGTGTTGPGISGRGSSTPSGGVIGLTEVIPQMVQFTNRVAIALGNGYPPQVFFDNTGTTATDTAATSSVITAISVVSSGLVTVTPTSITGFTAGSYVTLAGVTDAAYDGTFQIVSVSGGTFKVQNIAVIGHGASSGGTARINTSPIPNTFKPAYPKWTEQTPYSVGSIVEPSSGTGSYFKAIQGGTSVTVPPGAEPTWPSGEGSQVPDGNIIWQNQGLINSTAPALPGCAHFIVYSDALWAWNTYPIDVTTGANAGLDGPTSLRMSDVNNMFSWNPINHAFIDKDDGQEGMGLATFTISAEGIPPEGSLVAFKNYASYQIVGIFGSSNFAIQRTRSDMGCLAPRSIWFAPGYGIVRYAHLGVALFDGVRDQVISEEVRPYLFPTNDSTVADITVADANWIPASMGALTANPPMYAFAIPIGTSNGALTRILTYDLVVKGWSIIDLPFSISAMTQVRPTPSNPLTIFGSFDDGTLQRWQAGDSNWYAEDTNILIPVAWSFRTPEAFDPTQDNKLYCKRIAIRGITSGATALTVQQILNGATRLTTTYPIVDSVPSTGDFEVFAAYRLDGLRYAAVISGSGHIEIDRVNFQIQPKRLGVPMRVT